VKGLRRDDASLCNMNKGMRDMALNFYQNLNSSKGSDQADWVLPLMDYVISEEMNSKLTRVFSDK
jgi:hypothetical protein